MGVKGFFREILESQLLEYETPKIVHIQSPLIGVLHRAVQLTIILYVIIWVFVVENGYQYIDKSATSGTTIKVKGVSFTHSNDPRVGQKIWDTSDLIVPPQQNDAFFVTTNLITTHHQTRGVCPEPKGVPGVKCASDRDCRPRHKPFHLGHGVSSGKCNNATGTCEVKAWCPIEVDYPLPNNGERAVIAEAKNFTALIKSHVHFPYYKTGRSNLIESITNLSCLFHPVTAPYCPVFRLADIVSLAETDNNPEKMSDSYFDRIAIEGGVISIAISWDCDLDYDESKCKPKYQFTRLDNFNGNTIAAGYNFRHATHFVENGEPKRELHKAYGILFLINVEAQARAFNLVTFTQNVGSGLALVGIATLCSDFFLTTLHKKKTLYKKHIYHHVSDDVDKSGVREPLNRKEFTTSCTSDHTPDNHWEDNSSSTTP